MGKDCRQTKPLWKVTIMFWVQDNEVLYYRKEGKTREMTKNLAVLGDER